MKPTSREATMYCWHCGNGNPQAVPVHNWGKWVKGGMLCPKCKQPGLTVTEIKPMTALLRAELRATSGEERFLLAMERLCGEERLENGK